ncbi:hypothetical protein J31TS4_45280 [Paenibacillus sp. J31TS4]|uniref:DUF6147 family protein n=1 Tax=Paenibacillus sp. J31TS4 TaxID=2807195 RepID=UPI001B14946D|nr:DUF6147 family protein [Paenibacillus sp. J31TS4]GIP41248.1 hypothetical protein J31TS4_45280 [Paenibacillus sp. J31TS4]
MFTRSSLSPIFRKWLAVPLAVMLTVPVFASAAAAEAGGAAVQAASESAAAVYPNGAKTPPPPESDMKGSGLILERSSSTGSMQPNAINPGQIYLSSGNASLVDRGGGKAGMIGQTYATQIVDTVGLEVRIQRWTGSSWDTLYTTPTITNSNSANVYGQDSALVTKGYYYRAWGYHFIIQGTAFESGYTYSDSILIN